MVRRSFEQESFDVDGRREAVTVSIGVAGWPDSGETYDVIVDAAGRAMTEAKKNRNSVRVASGQSS